MLGRQAPPRNLAIRLISSHGTASASTFLLDEWPILNFVFEVDCFFLPSKREAFFVSSLKAHPSPKLTNNVSGYVLTEQFPNDSGADQICSHRTVSFMSICSHGTGTEMVRYRVHFWTNVRKSAVCSNKLSTGRPKHVKDDRRSLNLWIERSQRSLAR